MIFLLQHFTLGNAFRARCSQRTPHSVGITLHTEHRHYFFLCIFRSLPTLNLSCLTSLRLTFVLRDLMKSERPNTTCLEPFELSLLSFERSNLMISHFKKTRKNSVALSRERSHYRGLLNFWPSSTYSSWDFNSGLSLIAGPSPIQKVKSLTEDKWMNEWKNFSWWNGEQLEIKIKPNYITMHLVFHTTHTLHTYFGLLIPPESNEYVWTFVHAFFSQNK